MYDMLKKLARKKIPAQTEFINYSQKHLGCHFGWTICTHSRKQADWKEPLSQRHQEKHDLLKYS